MTAITDIFKSASRSWDDATAAPDNTDTVVVELEPLAAGWWKIHGECGVRSRVTTGWSPIVHAHISITKGVNIENAGHQGTTAMHITCNDSNGVKWPVYKLVEITADEVTNETNVIRIVVQPNYNGGNNDRNGLVYGWLEAEKVILPA